MGSNALPIIRFLACFICLAGLIGLVVYGVKFGIDSLGKTQAKADMNLAVSEKSKVTEASKTENTEIIDRLKFDGIFIEKMGMNGKMESKLLEGKISEDMKKIENFEEKTREKEERKEKTFRLEFIIVVNMFGMLALMVITGVICMILKRKNLLCWKKANGNQENKEMEEERNVIWI